MLQSIRGLAFTYTQTQQIWDEKVYSFNVAQALSDIRLLPARRFVQIWGMGDSGWLRGRKLIRIGFNQAAAPVCLM